MSMYLAHAHLCRLRGAAVAGQRRTRHRRIVDQAAHDAVAQWRERGWLR